MEKAKKEYYLVPELIIYSFPGLLCHLIPIYFTKPLKYNEVHKSICPET